MSPLEESADELTSSIRRLDESVRRANDVRDELDDVVKMTKKNKLLIRGVIIGLTCEVILLCVMILLGVQATNNTNQINRLVKVQHDSALCPLYRIFIESDTPENRARAAAQGQDMAQRAQQFAIIRRSYAALKCATK
jgi:hypothetical protein